MVPPSRHPELYYTLVSVTLLVGYLLAVVPVSPRFILFRPEFVCLLVIYWIMHTPQHLGMFFGFSVGLLQDVIESCVWGAHALSLTVIAYICLVSYQRIRNYSVWHQTMWIFVLVGVHQVFSNWVQGLVGYYSDALQLLLPTMMSALCWPLLSIWLLRLKRSYRLI